MLQRFKPTQSRESCPRFKELTGVSRNTQSASGVPRPQRVTLELATSAKFYRVKEAEPFTEAG